MSKKDYIKLAQAIRETRTIYVAKGRWAGPSLNDLQDRIADILAADNPQFDRERFNTACKAESYAERQAGGGK
jgi:hypothetical protein